jgi:hypothetical protein
MAHGYSRMGKAAGAGFYDYNETPPQLWSGLKTFERRNRGIPAQDITDRLTHAAMLAALSTDDSTDSELIAASLGPKIAASAAQALDMLSAADRHRFIDRNVARVALGRERQICGRLRQNDPAFGLI